MGEASLVGKVHVKVICTILKRRNFCYENIFVICSGWVNMCQLLICITNDIHVHDFSMIGNKVCYSALNPQFVYYLNTNMIRLTIIQYIHLILKGLEYILLVGQINFIPPVFPP